MCACSPEETRRLNPDELGIVRMTIENRLFQAVLLLIRTHQSLRQPASHPLSSSQKAERKREREFQTSCLFLSRLSRMHRERKRKRGRATDMLPSVAHSLEEKREERRRKERKREGRRLMALLSFALLCSNSLCSFILRLPL